MTSEEQVDLWVEGKCVHNDEHPANRKVNDRYVGIYISGGECCPDFSCCNPDLLAPVEVRRAFKTAPQRQREKFLMHFLRALISKTPVKVHIMGELENQ